MGYGYQSSQTPPMNTSNNSQSTSMTMNYYVNSANLAAPTGNSLSFSRSCIWNECVEWISILSSHGTIPAATCLTNEHVCRLATPD
ncbi:hypothetical protein Plhal703r1_c80g0173661 [Plasmopara halstedii]